MMTEMIVVVLLCGCLVTLSLATSKLKNNLEDYEKTTKHLVPGQIYKGICLVMAQMMALGILGTIFILKFINT